MPVSRNSIGRVAGAALVASLLAGCSADSLRFQDGYYGADQLTTASVPKPQADIQNGQSAGTVPAGGYPAVAGQNSPSQPYPGDASANDRYALAPVSGGQSIQQSSLPPVGASQPQTAAQRQLAADPLTTSATPASGDRPKGWSTEGAPRVTMQANETIYSISRRYGVPVDEIMRANGISDATKVAPGQQLVIPGFSRGGSMQAAAPSQQAPQAQASVSSTAGQTDPALTERSLNEQAAAMSAQAGASSQAGGSYTVQSGDTLSKISRQTGVSVAQIRSANGLSGDAIRIGQTLQLGGAGQTQTASAAPKQQTDPQQTASVEPAPAVETAAVETGATKPAGYTPPSKPESAEMSEAVGQDMAAIAPDTTGIGKLRWPVRGQVVTAFGAQDGNVRNDGIDILVPEGSEVKAAENGVVIYAGSGLKEYGNTVLVRHDNGLVTVYGHAKELSVNRGDTVSRGQVIARSGMTGAASQPKLHFEVRENATPVNPTGFLE
ncbi:peptidoglycan DD-metalloendopeptidase family protein [Pararhizobium haloflavum]|uniref:peptidoglycan DD-metalloendopeptidase family protein n=1 Tax=Pararhizobium haloflavum TaxID=2037914 RepID=UPI0018E44C67|nr:peptidoglycan DD-metalloendopeptidase family protein [Pararhizobium haloflavum]